MDHISGYVHTSQYCVLIEGPYLILMGQFEDPDPCYQVELRTDKFVWMSTS